MKTLADTFKALSDETRLQVMTLLMENDELCVCDFVGTLGQTQSKVSRHLRYLYNAGLVSDRRAGLWMHYRIAPDLTPEQAAVLAGLSQAVGEEQRRELRTALQSWLETKTASGPGESPPTACCAP